MRYQHARRNDWTVPHAGFAALRHAAAQARDAEAPRSVHETLSRTGTPLEPQVRREFESRTGSDFSSVRVHTDEAAARSARDVGALAYTVGSHMVFGRGRYTPGSSEGKKLLAHELTHVDQQRGASLPSSGLRIGRSGESHAQHAESQGVPGRSTPGSKQSAASIQRAPDPEDVKKFDKEITAIRALDTFKKRLDAAHISEFDQIVDIARKRDNPLYYSGKLKLLFTTAESGAAAQSAKMAAETQAAADQERKRLGKSTDVEKGREEAVSRARAKKFRPAVGLDGKTIFAIDDSDVTDIAVRAQVQLVKKGTGTNVDVQNVKALEDAIEKRGSTLGYSLDIAFVNKPGANVFTVNVDTSEWTVASNWVGDDVGLVHELHHLLGLGQDRYDYIEGHAGNEDMDIPDRLHWFREEFKKTIANDPESMMNTGARVPLDDDICRVAGKSTQKDVDDCVKARADARAARLKPGIDQALDWLTKAAAAPAAKRESVAKAVFTSSPPAKDLSSAIAAARTPLAAGNMQLFSELTDDCKQGPAFARVAASRTIGLCPPLLSLGIGVQGRALLRAALHAAAIGSVAGKSACPSADCTTTCGDISNANAWVRFIECSASP